MEVLYKIISFLTAGWVILSILAGLLYAIVEFIDEHVLEKMHTSNEGNAVGTLVLFSGFFGIIVSAGFMTYTALWGSFADLQMSPDQMWRALLVGGLEVAWMIPYLYAINRGGAINAGPLFQLVPVMALILGFLIFDETPGIWQIIGGLSITAGGFLLTCQRDTFKLDTSTITLMALASLIVSIGYFIFKDVVGESNFIATSFWGGIGMFMMSWVVWLGYPPYRKQFNVFIKKMPPKIFVWQATNEMVNSMAVVASHVAVILAPSVMIASSLNAAHPIFILVLGFILKVTGSKKHKQSLEGARMITVTIAIVFIATGTAVIAF